MKHIHMKKPDIKGFFQKIRNLKMQDIKEHFKERKERRRQILEKRRNGKFARKMQPVYRMMNRLSLVLHYLLACVLNFIIEIISRHSLFEAWDYLVGTPKVFFFNAFLIFATFSIVYLVRRRVFARILLSVFWLALGVCNGYMLLKRVTPFNAQDLKAWSEGLAVSKNYFSAMEFVLLGVGIVAVILWVISMWRRGGQYTGKMHRVWALFGVVISIGAYIGLTNIAIAKGLFPITLAILHLHMKITDSRTVLLPVSLIQEFQSLLDTVKRQWMRSQMAESFPRAVPD